MQKSKSIPTIFAVSIAENVGLMPSALEELVEEEDFTVKNPELRLISFQQMAIACPIEQCMLAYHGVELSEEQLAGLQLIYESTTPWLIGHVISELVDSSGTAKTAEFILTQLIKDGKVDENVAKGLLVKLELVDSKTPIKGK